MTHSGAQGHRTALREAADRLVAERPDVLGRQRLLVVVGLDIEGPFELVGTLAVGPVQDAGSLRIVVGNLAPEAGVAREVQQ